jgi:hypothetical protein
MPRAATATGPALPGIPISARTSKDGVSRKALDLTIPGPFLKTDEAIEFDAVTRTPNLVCEMSAISRHFECRLHQYALEMDWLAGAAGFETQTPAWGGWIRTSAFQNRNSPRLSAWAAGFEPLHIEIIQTADVDRQVVA